MPIRPRVPWPSELPGCCASDMEGQADVSGLPVQGREAAQVNFTPVTLLPS